MNNQSNILINEEKLKKLLAAPDTIDFVTHSSARMESCSIFCDNVARGALLKEQYSICYASPEVLAQVNPRHELSISYLQTNVMVLTTLDTASIESAGILQVQQQTFLNLRGQGVIMGFVDTGIDYTLPVFKHADGTSKILYIYDQTVNGPAPEGLPFGIEYTNEQLNNALRSEKPLDIVPEQDNATGHGTFIASVAAGSDFGDYSSAAPDSEIVFVKLRRARPYFLQSQSIPEDQPNAFESSDVMLGLEYILNKARQLNRPVVICFGLGTNQGGHNCLTIFEQYMAEVASENGVCICVPAGNESQAHHHMSGRIPVPGGTAKIDVRVDSNGGDIMVSIRNNASDRFSVSVTAPTGESVSRLPAKPHEQRTTNLILVDSKIHIEYHFPAENCGQQDTLVKITNAVPGIWSIIVYGDIVVDGTFQAWLPITGFCPPGIEFINPDPYLTITVPSAMLGGICFGAYDPRENSLYPQSSWGPGNFNFPFPDLAAPGVNVGGYYPTGPGIMSGTSIATAIASGANALLMQWGIVEENDLGLSSYSMRAYLIRGADRQKNIHYPNLQWGWGSLNLLKTFQNMQEL